MKTFFHHLKQLYMESPLRASLRQEVEKFARDHCRKKSVFDFGGGVNSFAEYFSKYHTLDFDGKECPDVLGDLELLPLKSESVEGGICIDVLEHVVHPWKALAEIARVLQPNAPFMVHVPFVHNVHAYPSDYHRFTADGIRLMIEEAGFEVLETDFKPYSGFFYTMSHIYRFIYEPRPPLFLLRFLGFVMLWLLRPLDRKFRRGNMKLFYIGVHVIARKKSNV